MEPIELPGDLQSLGPVADYVKAATQEAGITGREAYRLRLAVEELVTNAVTHGYERSGTEGTVRLSADVQDGALTLCLEDTSPPFDPRDAPEPDLEAALEDRQIGGLGVYLTLRGVDDFSYDRVDGRNVSRLTVRRPVAVPSEA